MEKMLKLLVRIFLLAILAIVVTPLVILFVVTMYLILWIMALWDWSYGKEDFMEQTILFHMDIKDAMKDFWEFITKGSCSDNLE